MIRDFVRIELENLKISLDNIDLHNNYKMKTPDCLYDCVTALISTTTAYCGFNALLRKLIADLAHLLLRDIVNFINENLKSFFGAKFVPSRILGNEGIRHEY